jgi:hypothetical protein
MFIRICLLSVLAMGALAGPALSDDGAAATLNGGERPSAARAGAAPAVHHPRKSHVHAAAPACPNSLGQC